MKLTAIMKISMLITLLALSVGAVATRAGNAADLSARVVLQPVQPVRTYEQDVTDPYNPVTPPINLKIAIANESGEDIIISSKFLSRDYHLDLQFTRFLPDGRQEVIITSTPVNLSEPTKAKQRVVVGDVLVNTPVEQVDILEPEWFSATEWFVVNNYYPLVKPGRYEVRAVIPRIIYNGPVITSNDGFSYKEITEENSVLLEGDLVSPPVAFHIVADKDGDTYFYPQVYGANPNLADCDDDNPAVYPGATEMPGDDMDNDCDPLTPDTEFADPGFIEILAHTHSVGPGSLPGVNKTPIAGMPLRVYDKSDGSCVTTGYGVSWQYYPNIWAGCSPLAAGRTDTFGRATLEVPTGTYIVIGLTDGQYIGRSVDVVSGETSGKYMQIIVKANGKKSPAKYTRKTGSELLIIEPEYVEWSGTEEYYPFVFESAGDWGVTTSVAPPEGFVADHDSLSEEVTSEIEAVQFVITDIGSDWVATGVTHEIKHKGKKEKIKSKIGVKLSKELAKQKGLDIYGKKLKKNKD